MPDTSSVSHNTAANQFEIPNAAGTALLRYRRQGDVLDLLHTEVPEAIEGTGYGSALVAAALAYADKEHLTIIPSCPFVAAYIRRHPQHERLVADV